MSTASELGFMVNQTPDPSAVKEVISEPSLEWLESFGERFQDSSGEKRTPSTFGKFVVFNEFIVTAPFPRSIGHMDIVKAAQLGFPERVDAEIAAAQAEERDFLPLSYNVLTDAGFFLIQPDRLILSGESGWYGSADHAGRRRTAELTQAALKGFDVEARF